MDLRGYLNSYEVDHPEHVLHVEREIDCRYVATSLVAKLERRNRFPVLVFHRVKNVLGRPSAFPVVTGLLSSRTRCAELIGATNENLGQVFYRAMSERRLKPVVVPREEAAVKQVRLLGDRVNLFELPALVHHDTDPGPYITAGYFTCYDPETGIDNSTLHRCWIKDERELRVYLGIHTHAKACLVKHETRGRDMRVALWIGHHPAAMLGAETKQPYGGSHYEAAGGFLGAPLRLVSSETLGDDFLVPADAQFVIEGIMRANSRVPEGPFGEMTGYVGPEVKMPYLEVTAITHRADACWVDFQVGYAENRMMLSLPVEGAVFELLQSRIPSFRNVYVPVTSAGFHAFIQLENPLPGEARDAMTLALSSNRLLKHVFVVDEDVNIFDEKEVLWAAATRLRWERDVLVLPTARGSGVDPVASSGTVTKAGFDCTSPDRGSFPKRNAIPAGVFDSVLLEDFFPSGGVV